MTLPLESIWAIEPMAGERLAAALKATPAEALRSGSMLQPAEPLEIVDDGAVVSITGVLTKSPTIFQRLFGGTSTRMIEQAVNKAASNDRIKAIVLAVDSPGGSVAGLAEAADAIFAARKTKTLVAQGEGMCASGAYHLASQAEKIYAQRMDSVGSIGTRGLLFDLSEMFSKKGIRAIPIDSGEFKSAGAPGTEITERQVEHFQHIVDQYQADFLASILRGRRIKERDLRTVADGRIFVAGEAVRNGLIDGIKTFEQTLVALQNSRAKSNTSRKEKIVEATYQEIVTACPGASPEFICGQLAAKAMISDAREAYAAHQTAEINRLKSEANKPPESTGNQSLGTRPSSGQEGATGGVTEFGELVKARMAQGMSRRNAVRAAARENPDLHHRHVSETNSGGRQIQGLIDDRFGN